MQLRDSAQVRTMSTDTTGAPSPSGCIECTTSQVTVQHEEECLVHAMEL